jgi:hypothetical protein
MKPPFDNEPSDADKAWDVNADLPDEDAGNSPVSTDEDEEIIELVEDEEIIELVDIVEDGLDDSPVFVDSGDAEVVDSGIDAVEDAIEDSDEGPPIITEDLDNWFETDLGEHPVTDPLVASMGLDLEAEDEPPPEVELVAIPGGALGIDLPEAEAPETPPDVAPIELTPEQIESALERVIEKIYAEKIESLMVGLIEEKVTREIDKIKSLIMDEQDEDTPYE